MTSDSVMPPTPALMTLTWISSWGSLAISSSKASSGARDVGLEHEVEVLDVALLDALEDVLEGDLAPGPAGLGLVAQPDAALVGLLARGAVVLDHVRELARVGDAVEAEDLDRIAGDGHVETLAVVGDHRADLAPVRAGHERVADAQRAALDEQRHDRAAARVEPGLDDDAAGLGLGVGAELLELGDDEDRVEQVVEALMRLGRDVDELGVAAPVGGLQVERRHLRAHARRGRRPPCRPC